MEMTTLYTYFKECGRVTTDTRNCPEGSMFIALKGETFNGNMFARQALEKGCRYAVVDEAEYAGAPGILLVDDCLKTLQMLAREHRRTMGTRIIGITGTNITEETAPMYKLPVGALVLEIVEGSPAEKAGLQVGDVITQFNGQTVMDMDSLVKQVNEAKIGSTADMYVIRDGNTGVELKIKIEDKNS